MAVTFSEIMEATGWSHNTVSHKMKVLGITPSFRKGRVFYRGEDDSVLAGLFNSLFMLKLIDFYFSMTGGLS